MQLANQSPQDLFSSDNFLTAENPAEVKLTSADRQLLEEAQRAEQALAEQDFPAMHKEPQESTVQSKQHIRENYSREVLAQERVEASIQSLKPSKYGLKVPQAKDVFADIISSGDYREFVEVAKHSWEIRALEQSDVLCAADDVRDTADGRLGYLNAFSFAKLVYAIEGVDGYSIYELFPDILPTSFVNKIDYIIAVKMAMRAYLLAFPVPVIDELTEHQTRIEEVRDAKITKLKNS